MAGRRIDDFGGYAKDADALMSSKTHTKKVVSHDDHAIGIRDYEDTNERVVSVQKAGSAKIKSHDLKDGYRH